MIHHHKLTPAGLKRLAIKFFLDALKAGNYKFEEGKLLVPLNYHNETEYVLLGGIHNRSADDKVAQAALVDFLILTMSATL